MASLRIITALFLATLLSACSSLPDQLASTNENLITDYGQWLAQDADMESEIRLGGMIANVTNLKDKTRIEIANMPISSAGKPNLKANPEGRFVAYFDGYLEPMTYSEGRLITVLGNSAGEEQGQVGEYDYKFRVLNASGSHLWRIEESVIVQDHGSYLSPCIDQLHCRSMRMSVSKGRIVQEVK
ncbi:Slp family lipoprotein [Vibrio hannami]|uniref:Slp family lipoprotein n=1 Tax=Vibrio hannami TaxID=2717094 RepID=UPI00240F0EDC|nr:Slp family lipoprotein [Vibrio hannami]MDG3087491.1 Slp family lipoprotein [Vibrio hannami]